jgi:ankyrin repeat protein
LKENNPTEYRIFQTKMRAYPEQLSFVKYFFKFCRDPDRIKNFLIATKQNHLEEAERFLKEGIFVDVRHSLNGPTPLVQALQDENIPMAMLLVEYGAKLNVQCNVNQAPLFVACQKNLAGMAAFLLGKGAEVDIRNRDGLTALHITSELNQKNSLIYC